MRRFPAILLLLGFAVLGSGLLQDLHLRTHRLEHAAAHPRHHDDDAPAAPEQHEEADCGLCANLLLPRLSVGWVPVLICLGLFVVLVTHLAPRLAPQRSSGRIDCRGPPVL